VPLSGNPRRQSVFWGIPWSIAQISHKSQLEVAFQPLRPDGLLLAEVSELEGPREEDLLQATSAFRGLRERGFPCLQVLPPVLSPLLELPDPSAEPDYQQK
jgi:hypothetical protein